jgi:hypothetical protein
MTRKAIENMTTPHKGVKTRVALWVDVTPRQLAHLFAHMRLLRIPFSTVAARDLDEPLKAEHDKT